MLEVKHLHKTFGSFVAVDDASFKIEDGKILGMIGQNGAGKTTVFRMILDFLTPENGGSVLWNGTKINSTTLNQIGYLPEERGLYEKLTIEQQIIYFAQLRGMRKKDIQMKIDDWMLQFNVKGKRTDKIKTLSKGNQQKVQLIATLIHEPKLAILDEPFSGLDPVNADFLKAGILKLKENGSCIIFSSHNMANVESICDEIVMLHHGKQVLNGTVDEIRNSFGKTEVTVTSHYVTLEELQSLDYIKSVIKKGVDTFQIKLYQENDAPLLFHFVSKGNYIPTFHQHTPSLEEIFKLKAGDNNA